MVKEYIDTQITRNLMLGVLFIFCILNLNFLFLFNQQIPKEIKSPDMFCSESLILPLRELHFVLNDGMSIRNVLVFDLITSDESEM